MGLQRFLDRFREETGVRATRKAKGRYRRFQTRTRVYEIKRLLRPKETGGGTSASTRSTGNGGSGENAGSAGKARSAGTRQWFFLETHVKATSKASRAAQEAIPKREFFVGRVLSEYPSALVLALGKKLAKNHDANLLVLVPKKQKGGGRAVVAFARVRDPADVAPVCRRVRNLAEKFTTGLARLVDRALETDPPRS